LEIDKMANRTIKLHGSAFSDSGDVSVNVSFNGVEVFNGTVTTLGMASKNALEVGELLSFEVDDSISGSVPVSIRPSNGDITVQRFVGNHCMALGTHGDATITETSEEYTSFDDLGDGYTDKTNVTINSDPITITDAYDGSWIIQVDGGEVISFDATIKAVIPTTV